jgi:hypothetical protein
MIEKFLMWSMQCADRQFRRGSNAARFGKNWHHARDAGAGVARDEAKKKARPKRRRAFQQNVWQLLVGPSL